MIAIEHRVQGVLLAMFAALLGVVSLAFVFTRQTLDTAGWVSHTHAVLTRIESVRMDIAQVQSDLRAYVVTADPAFLAAKDAGLSNLSTHVVALREMTADNPIEQRNVDALAGRIRYWERRSEDVELARTLKGFAAARALVARRHMATAAAAVFGTLAAMRAEERGLLARRIAEERRMGYVVSALYVLLCIVSLALSAVVYAQIRRRIRHWQEVQKELERLNADLQHQAVLLADANAELESFSYSVSHDLRAPLRAVDGFSRILETDYGGHLDAEGLRLLGVIRTNSKRMGALIDDLLTLSRLGRKPLQHAQVDMQALAAEALEEVKASGTDAARTAIDLGPLPPAWGDRALLRQVWVNLLSNAVKYSSRSAQPMVAVSGQATEAEVSYSVRDNGVGFDMRYYDKLFGVFQRLHGHDQFEGTGVGLAIVKRIVARHGGRVWAQSEPDQGALFQFALPCAEEEK